MRKVAYIEKLGNGLLVTVTKDDGVETQFFVMDDGSVAFKAVEQAYDMGQAASTGRSYREPPEETSSEGHRVTVEDEPPPPPPSYGGDDYDDDDPSIVGDTRYLLQSAADFVGQNPAVGQFLGSVFAGATSAEKRRHAMKKAEREARQKK